MRRTPRENVNHIGAGFGHFAEKLHGFDRPGVERIFFARHVIPVSHSQNDGCYPSVFIQLKMLDSKRLVTI